MTALRFDRYTLDPARASLRCGTHELVLRPKSFDVLRYLAENAGRVVSKDELFGAVWKDVTVTDDSLVQCIRDIRQVLDRDAQALIRTVPRRGYIFDAEVTHLAPGDEGIVAGARGTDLPESGPPLVHRGRIVAIVAAAVVLICAASVALWQRGVVGQAAPPHAGPPSIAVLFASAGPEGSNRTYDYFSDGLTDDVIGALGRFSGLRVLARASLNPYKSRVWEPQLLGRELKVRYIVDGDVRRSGDRLRVSARLTDTAQQILLWSETYDDELKDMFAVQDRLTRSIVGRLAVRIGRVEHERSAAKPTSNMEAYDYVLRGREKLARITRADNLEARRLFNAAAELDPRYAAAFVGLGHTHHNDLLFGWSGRPDEASRRSYEFANRAIVLDDKDPAGYLLLSNIYVVNREYALALAEADRGLALNPNDADGHAGRGAVLVWMGRVDDAIAAFETAAQFDPNQSRPRSLAHLGLAYFLSGRYGDAARAFELSIGRNPEFSLAYIGLAASLAELGRLADAQHTAEMLRRVDPLFTSASFGTQFADDTHRRRIVESLKKVGL